jgi:hypothetical protein
MPVYESPAKRCPSASDTHVPRRAGLLPRQVLAHLRLGDQGDFATTEATTRLVLRVSFGTSYA